MVAPCPKTVFTAFGLFVCSALIDGAFRFGFFPVVAPISICNPGVGLGIEFPETSIWIVIVLILALALSQSLKQPLGVENLAWGVIFIGGATNAIDRYAHGCVLDYLHLPFFPSFNWADIIILFGVVSLGLLFLGVLPNKAKSYAR